MSMKLASNAIAPHTSITQPVVRGAGPAQEAPVTVDVRPSTLAEVALSVEESNYSAFGVSEATGSLASPSCWVGGVISSPLSACSSVFLSYGSVS